MGAPFGAFLGALTYAFCESEGSDCPAATASVAGGAAFVGVLVGGVGALIGAAFPRWRTAWVRGRGGRAGATVVAVEPRADSSAPPPARRKVGEVTALITGGYVSFPAAPTTAATAGPGVGATFGLGWRAGRVAFGPETGLHLGTGGSAWMIAGTGRVVLARSARAARERYVVLGAGANVWASRQALVTATLGLGETRRGRWRAELRWNPVLQYSDPYSPHPTFVTFGVGRVIAW
jgi:hypothetical protein